MPLLLAAPPAGAKVSWTFTQEFELDGAPLAMEVSRDGKLFYFLTPNQLLVYDTVQKKVTDRLPVGAGFDRLAYSAAEDVLILMSSTSPKVQVVKIEPIVEIDVSGLPFKGPENAPVIIAVFDDYQ